MQVVFVAILVLHLLLSLLLVIVVLVQQRTKGGMAGVFGGGGGTGAEQIFGSSGVAPFMTRITSILGAAFLVTSLVLVLLSVPASRTRQTQVPVQQSQTQQTAPIPQPVGPEEGQSTTDQVPGQVVIPDTTGSGGN